MLEQIVQSTQNLNLRPLQINDSESVRQGLCDPQINFELLLNRNYYSKIQAEEWISEKIHQWQKGILYSFAITNNSHQLGSFQRTDQFIGFISLKLNPSHLRGHIDFWILPEFRNRGYATESVKSIISLGLNGLGLNKITAQHFYSNPIASRVLSKSGMVQEGIFQQHIFRNDKLHDCSFYAVLKFLVK